MRIREHLVDFIDWAGGDPGGDKFGSPPLLRIFRECFV